MELFGYTFERKSKSLKAKSSRQPETIELALDKWAVNHPDWKVKLQWRENPAENAARVASWSLLELSQIDDIEAYIASAIGGSSHFQLVIYGTSGEFKAQYPISVIGEKEYRPPGRQKRHQDREGTSGGKNDFATLLENAAALKTIFGTPAPPEGGTFLEKAWLKDQEIKAQREAQGPGESRSEAMMDQLFQVMFNNQLNREENRLEEFKQQLEISQLMTPKLPAEDTTAALIAAIGPIIGNILTARMGGAPAPSLNAGNIREVITGLPIETMLEVAKTLPDDQKQALIAVLSGNALPATGEAVLPRPGALPGTSAPESTIQQETEQEVVGAVGGVLPSNQSPPASPAFDQDNPFHQSINTMIGEIRSNLAQGLDPVAIAHKVIALVGFAKSYTKQAPHPMLYGLMNSTTETADAAFEEFCNQIPELVGQPEKQDALGLAIYEIMTGVLQQPGEEEAQIPQEPIRLEDVVGEQAIETEDRDHDVPGSTGLPRKEGPVDDTTDGRSEDSGSDEELEDDQRAVSAL